MGLVTLHNCFITCSLEYLKSKLESKSRLPIPEFSGSHCILTTSLISRSGLMFNPNVLYFDSSNTAL